MSGESFPLISVITPAYNHEKYVQDTIQSILDQDYPNIEYIIIDDGSKDDTYNKILEKGPFAESRLTKFTAITKKNEGIIKTLNMGLNVANGEYVYIIASDDMADPTAITTLYEFLSKNCDYGLAVGDDNFIDENGTLCYWDKDQNITYDAFEAHYKTFAQYLMSIREDVDFYGEEFGKYETLITGNYVPNGYLIRKTILDKIGGYCKEGVLEDFFLMLQISKISRLKFINSPLFSYRWHSRNTVKQKVAIERLTYKTILNEWDYFSKDNKLKSSSIIAVNEFSIYLYHNPEHNSWLKEILNNEKNRNIKKYVNSVILHEKKLYYKSKLKKMLASITSNLIKK